MVLPFYIGRVEITPWNALRCSSVYGTKLRSTTLDSKANSAFSSTLCEGCFATQQNDRAVEYDDSFESAKSCGSKMKDNGVHDDEMITMMEI